MALYLAGECGSGGSCKERAVVATRQLAKRQLTWLRRRARMPSGSMRARPEWQQMHARRARRADIASWIRELSACRGPLC